MLNRKALVPIMAAALVTASIIFGITRSSVQNNNQLLSGLINMVTRVSQ